MPDNTERCERCRFFDPHGGESDLLSDLAGGLGLGPESASGRCRRYPPNPKWPGVMLDDWCGEFRPGGNGNWPARQDAG
ncbi:MAG: hypothetical protein VB959_21640 [Rhodospirillales bacterium]|jgi:hypothetical protein